MIKKARDFLRKAQVFLEPSHRKWTLMGLLGAVLLLSSALFVFQERPLGRFVLFFPEQKEKSISGEERYLPLHSDRSQTMALVMKESLLGPVRSEHYRLFGPGTRLNSFIFDQGKVFADLSPEATFSWNSNNYWSLDEALKTLGDSLKFNFKEIGEVNITVAGQIPFREISEKK